MDDSLPRAFPSVDRLQTPYSWSQARFLEGSYVARESMFDTQVEGAGHQRNHRHQGGKYGEGDTVDELQVSWGATRSPRR
jgi:hypothetical protein